MSALTFTTDDSFENIMRLQRAISHSLGRPFFGLDWTPSGQDLYPALNLFEEKDRNSILVKAEIPGIDRESLEVETVGNRLMIAGRREIASPEGQFRYHRRERRGGEDHLRRQEREDRRRERRGGEFRRVFRLPFEVDRGKASASYHDGVLTIHLEKAESAKPSQIAIKT